VRSRWQASRGEFSSEPSSISDAADALGPCRIGRRTLLLALGAPLILPIGARTQDTGRAALPPGGRLQISGIYPHLAVFNDTGGDQDRECGIGALVPWAGKLWLLTYPPHRRTGSPDKLYAIDDELRITVRPESVGGTHAGRMIHRESQQLVIGPYFVDAKGGVRAVDQTKGFAARITGVARHLTDPAGKVYVFDMEGPVWEIDVRTLEPKRLFVKPVPGWHGKGAYTGQGRLVIANNGELRAPDLDKLTWELPEKTWSKGPEDAGALAEYDGERWSIVARRAFTEVTGPGGLLGEPSADAPLWSVGWDKRSVLLAVRSASGWSMYRLPKGSYTYDPVHGWFTEWPRIRAIGTGPLLLNMHGTFFDFPASFSRGNAQGVRPLATHLHYTTDFTEWNGRVVLAGDDTSILQNLLAARPQSNLRFLDRAQLQTDFGPSAGWGGMWMDDAVKAGEPSDPFLVTGFDRRWLHLAHSAGSDAIVTLELDALGDGTWRELTTVPMPAAGYTSLAVPADAGPGWLRVKANREGIATAFLHLQTPLALARDAATIFSSLARRGGDDSWVGGLLRPAGFTRDLQFLARRQGREATPSVGPYFEVNERLEFARVEAGERSADLSRAAEPTADFLLDAASVIVTDADGRRWRLPMAPDAFDAAGMRAIREVVSERYLAQFQGTFYEIPRWGSRNVPDFQRMKPVSSHAFRIADFATWRGLFVIAGTRADAVPDGHYFNGGSGPGLWFGAVDDLYKLGSPIGRGGPWKNTRVDAAQPSDPYLMTNYGRKWVALSHDRDAVVRFAIAVDFLANGSWHTHTIVDVPAREEVRYDFPDGFGAHWVRVSVDAPATATASFTYE
jgi:hypothetical protein